MTTQSVLDHHLHSLLTANLDELMSDYDDQSSVVTIDASYHGREAIRGFFSQAVEVLSHPKAKLELRQTRIAGETAMIVWDGETSAFHVDFATDSFVIRDGKILVQTVATKMTPKD
jgi:hypothetical protein